VPRDSISVTKARGSARGSRARGERVNCLVFSWVEALGTLVAVGCATERRQ